MKVLIAGSRNYSDQAAVDALVATLPAGTVILTGHAGGASACARLAARRAGLACVVCKPDYAGVTSRGCAVAAILKRNRRMVDKADIVHLFCDGQLTGGTAHEAHLAQAAGKPLTLHGADLGFFGLDSNNVYM